MSRVDRVPFHFLHIVIVVVTGLASQHGVAESAAPKRPNFVLIIGDDISDGDFGCYGHPNIRTPNVDKLAANGIRFTNAYLTTSQCSPTRCSVISGRYPHNTGAPELHQPLPEGQPMFPLELKKAGYHTAAAGKWHMGTHAKSAFDTVVTSRPGGEERWIDCLRERPKGRPFFMWFASYDAHRGWDGTGKAKKHQPADAVIPPYMADAPATRTDLALYYDEVQRLDRYVGLVVEELKRQDVLHNTIIIFMADNGRPFPRCKTWLYDGGIKTPLVVHWPGGIDRVGSVCRSLVSAIDLAPTILELAAVPTPGSLQGVSMVSILKDPAASIRQYAFAEHNWHDIVAHERMVRWKNWVYIRNARPAGAGLVPVHLGQPSYRDLLALRESDKLTAAQAEIFVKPRPAEMLFNVETDPRQLENLAEQAEGADTLAHLRKTLDEWQKRTGDTVPKVLTSDIVDRKTGKWLGTYNQPKRGTVPGSERNAREINDPGPQ